jgi:para-nitrobenzyl esterase
MKTVFLALSLGACTSGGGKGSPPTDSGDDSGLTHDSGPVDDTGAGTECGDDIPLESGLARTTLGVLEGTQVGGGWAYLGVRFGASPTGSERFLPPSPPTCSEELVQASTFGPACLHQDVQSDAQDIIGEEDCLMLNVWTPDDPADSLAAERAVLVFNHGGGHVAGSAVEGSDEYRLYDGAALAAELGVVVVTIQYRLGALGWLAHPALDAEQGTSGNLGLLDQRLAMQWVAENVASFGGDPDHVMLFGESAGAVDSCIHLASPDSAGLFSAVLMQSGGCGVTPYTEALAEGVAHVDDTSCAEASDVPSCLRDLPASELAALSQDPFDGGAVVGGGFGPVLDGERIAERPLTVLSSGRGNTVPVVLGSNSDETGRQVPLVFGEALYEATVRALVGADADAVLAVYDPDTMGSARQAWIQLSTDVQFTCPTRIMARALRDAHPAPACKQPPEPAAIRCNPHLMISAP